MNREAPPPKSSRRWLAVAIGVIGTFGLIGCTSTSTAESDLDPSVFDTRAETEPKPEKVPAVTQIGREILPRTGMVVLGTTERVSSLHGTEIGRFEVEEVLRSVPWDQMPDSVGTPTLTVFCGEPGMIPRRGRRAILLVRRRVGSLNHDVVQVVPITGPGGGERLDAYRRYLEIEGLPVEEERVEALLAYLRTAVRDSRRWTRDNAALEFGSLARFRPRDLGADDVPILRRASLRGNTAVVKRSLQTALSVAERNASRGPRGPRGPAPTVSRADELVPFTARFDTASDAAERRKILLEAAIALEVDAAPLLRRALDDPDPLVREAAAASAGQLRIQAVGSALLPLLSRDEPLPVTRSTVRALGHLRVADAVPTLAVLARNEGQLGDDACYALARIRNNEASAAMAQLLSSAKGERQELIEYLLTDAFVEQERALGRPID
jgi:HEAT repeat protein